MNKKILFTAALLSTTAFVAPAHAQSINYGMLEGIFGEPVTTSATGKPQRVSDAPVAMEIITQDDIKRSGTKDVPQLLQRYAGMSVQRSFIGRGDVSIRGYNQSHANRILVLVNGRQVLQDHFGETLWDKLPVRMEEIRQIEVVRGPNSSLFGFNAEQGVVNIVTFNPLYDDIDVVSARIGTQNHREVGGVYTEKLADNLGVRVSTGYLESDDFDAEGRNADKASGEAIRTRQLNVDLDWKINNKSELRLQANHDSGDNRVMLPHGSSSQPQTQVSSWHANYMLDSAWGLWSADLYNNRLNWNSVSSISDLSNDNDLIVGKISNLIKLNAKNSLRLALESRKNTSSGSLFGGSRFSYNLFAPSVMWDWQATDKLSTTVSTRYDRVDSKRRDPSAVGANSGGANLDDFSQRIEEVSYNVAAVYKQTDTDKWRASVARGLHIPSLIELGGGVAVGPGFFAGNPDLETESNTTIELGYTKELPDRGMTLGANIFRQDMKNVIVPTTGVTSFTFSDGGESTAYGIELTAEGKRDNLRWGANYTGIFAHDYPTSSNLDYDQQEPKHKLSVMAGWNINDKWTLDSDLTWVSSSEFRQTGAVGQVFEEKVDDYFVLNASLGYKFDENTDFALSGYNLIEKHAETAVGHTQSVLGYEVGGNNIGRSILLSVSRRF